MSVIYPPRKSKIKVLFVSHDGGMAGAQKTLLTLIENINQDNYSPYVFVPNKGKLYDRLVELKIPVFVRQCLHWSPCVSNKNEFKRLKYTKRFFKSLITRSWGIAALIKRYNIDIVYTNTVTCVEGAIAAKLTNKPHIWHIHEPLFNNSELCPIFPRVFYNKVINRLTDTIIFCSNSLSKDYPYLRKKAKIIYNGLPIPQLPDKAYAISQLESVLKFSIKHLNIVAVVGALQPRKDHITFINAASEVLKNDPNTLFIIVGNGQPSYVQSIETALGKLDNPSHIKIIDWWEPPINILLRAIDVLVISSEQESFGLTAIEALAMETPVVSTTCGGPEEIIEEGLSGLLVPTKNPTVLANAISHLLNSPKQCEQLGIYGRKKVKDKFSLTNYISEIENAITKLARRDA